MMNRLMMALQVCLGIEGQSIIAKKYRGSVLFVILEEEHKKLVLGCTHKCKYSIIKEIQMKILALQQMGMEIHKMLTKE